MLNECPRLWDISETMASPPIETLRLESGCAANTCGVIGEQCKVADKRGTEEEITVVGSDTLGFKFLPAARQLNFCLLPWKMRLPSGIAMGSRTQKLPARSLVHRRLLEPRAGISTVLRSTSIEYLATFSPRILALPAQNPLMDCEGTKL